MAHLSMVYHLVGGFNMLKNPSEKWWSSSMGRMTSHIWKNQNHLTSASHPNLWIPKLGSRATEHLGECDFMYVFLINAPIIKLGTTQITALLLTQIKKWNNINSNKLQELENPIFFKESFCFFQLLSRFFHGNIPLKSRTSQGYSMSSSTTPNLGPVRRPQLRAIDLRRRFKSCWWFRIMVVMPRFHKTTPTFKKMFESVHCT